MGILRSEEYICGGSLYCVMFSSGSSYEEKNKRSTSLRGKHKQGAPTVTLLADQQRKESKTISAAGSSKFCVGFVSLPTATSPRLTSPTSTSPLTPAFRCLPSTCNNYLSIHFLVFGF